MPDYDPADPFRVVTDWREDLEAIRTNAAIAAAALDDEAEGEFRNHVRMLRRIANQLADQVEDM